MTSLVARQRLPLEPRVIAFGGGGGGAGRSTCAHEIALHLLRRGRRVLLVDAALYHPHHATLLGVRPPSPSPQSELDLDHEDLHFVDYIVGEGRDTPALLSLRHLRRGPAFPPRLRAAQLIEGLRALNYDEILIDLDARADAFNASTLALADLPVLVTTAEANPLSSTAETLRQLIIFAILLQPEASNVEHRLFRALESLPPEFSIEDLHEAFSHTEIRDLLLHVLRHAQPWLLFNQTRDASERELPQAIALGLGAMTGVRPRVLGTIGYDAQRWLQVRQKRNADEPRAEELRAEGESLAIVAQRILSLAATTREQPRISPGEMRHPTELVGIPEEKHPREIRLAWRHLWDGLRRDSPFTRDVIPAHVRELLLMQLEEASQRLQTWLQSRETTEAPSPRTPSADSAIGRLLQNARATAGISIRDLSLRSRIGLRYLEAIENFEIEALPREVYLRGYLREVARALGLDPEALVEEYLAELHQTRIQKLRQADDEPSSQ